jgi:hypothetical protein
LKNSGQTLVEKNKSNLAGKISSELCCKIFSRTFSKIILSGFVQKMFKQSSGTKNLQQIPSVHPPKTTFFQSSLPLPSGHVSASVPPKISIKAQNGLRFHEDHPLFDRKLLEELHEQGVGNDRELSSVSEPQNKGF